MGGFNLPSQYDVSPKERRMVEDRAKMRAEFRKEFVKQTLNPHRHGTTQYLFDPAMQRWISMKSQYWYYFKPCYKSGMVSLFVVATCFGYGHWIQTRRDARDAKFRRGEVSYRDRTFKFV